jgi:ketosteroid isomerase-like protein
MSNETGFDPKRVAVLPGVILIGILAVLAGCAAEPQPVVPPPDPGDPIADRVQIVDVHETLLAAMEAGDGQAVLELFDDRHDVLVFHPELETRFDGRDEIAVGLARMMERLAPVDLTEVHLQVWTEGDVAWLTSHLLLESDALEEPVAARSTEVWRRNEDGWKLAHAHWSTHPTP